MKKIWQCAAIAAMALTGVSASAATVINGSFELGTDPGVFTPLGAGSNAITGWTIGGFGVDYIGTYWEASDGVRSVDLSNLNEGSVSQTLETIVGNSYTVTFDLSGNPDGGLDNKISVISISGSLPQIETYSVGPANSRDNMLWQTYSYTFTAFATASTLTFASAEETPFGPALDNVSIIDNGGGIGAGVPEPTSWAMLIAGFGLVGATARSRRRGGRSVTA